MILTQKIPDPDLANLEKSGKTGCDLFCSTAAEPGHLQTW